MTISTDPEGEKDQVNGTSVPTLIIKALLAVRQSAILFTALLGSVLILFGASPLVNGIFAGMFGIWGATLLACAGLTDVGLRILWAFDRRRRSSF